MAGGGGGSMDEPPRCNELEPRLRPEIDPTRVRVLDELDPRGTLRLLELVFAPYRGLGRRVRLVPNESRDAAAPGKPMHHADAMLMDAFDQAEGDPDIKRATDAARHPVNVEAPWCSCAERWQLPRDVPVISTLSAVIPANAGTQRSRCRDSLRVGKPLLVRRTICERYRRQTGPELKNPAHPVKTPARPDRIGAFFRIPLQIRAFEPVGSKLSTDRHRNGAPIQSA